VIGAPSGDGGAALALIAALRPRRPTLPVILIARRSTEALTIDALRLGVNDYFKIPFDHPDLLTTIRRHLPSPIASQPAAGFNPRFGRRVQGLTSEALACLMVYDWPGNVRELRNLIEATFINLPPARTAFMNLPAPFRRQMDALEAQSAATAEECRGVGSALIAADWNKSRAAQRLKWSRMTLYRKIEKYRIVQNRRPQR